MTVFRPGDRVYVTCPGLAELRSIMRQYGHEPAPNHHGTVAEVFEDGDLLIRFDDGGSAPYPPEETRLLPEPPAAKGASVPLECPRCSGAGEITDCANDGLCSHVNDRQRTCPDCNGSGTT